MLTLHPSSGENIPRVYTDLSRCCPARRVDCATVQSASCGGVGGPSWISSGRQTPLGRVSLCGYYRGFGWGLSILEAAECYR